MDLLIYVPSIANRISYSFKFIFDQILGINIDINTDKKYFLNFSGAKISYSSAYPGNEVHFKACGFLDEENVKPIDLATTTYRDYSICFPVKNSALPFDVFAATFYLLSRYEEYLPANLDLHGRYQAEESFAFKNGFLMKPVIDEWAFEILRIIQASYPKLKYKERQFIYAPTIDIDRAYAYKSAGLIHNSLRFAKSVLKTDFKKSIQIIRTSITQSNDPLDVYSLMRQIHGNIKPVFFFLTGDKAKFDHNLPHTNTAFQKLIKDVASYAAIGIHPSYESNLKPELLDIEKQRLENILRQKVTKSRQHFLKMSLPVTYRDLIAYGITDDYTMGYASQVGFRAGTCTPFNWFDLEKNEETILQIHPFAAMEVTLNRYMKLSSTDAINLLQQLCNSVKAVNGTFSTLWHNESLTETDSWKGWISVYQQIVKHATS